MDTQQLLDLEERFWKGDADFYQENVIDQARMAFADPVGVLTKDAAVSSISESSRWTSVDFEDVHGVALRDGVALLTYRAVARRGPHDSAYSARASSVYVDEGGWKLAFHQQTPIQNDV